MGIKKADNNHYGWLIFAVGVREKTYYYNRVLAVCGNRSLRPESRVLSL